MKALPEVPYWERGRLTEADLTSRINAIDNSILFIESQATEIQELKATIIRLKDLVWVKQQAIYRLKVKLK